MKHILPVIHHIDRNTTLEQAELAFKCGVDGVFLISHRGADAVLPQLGKEVVELGRQVLGSLGEHRSPFRVGLNLLNTPPEEAFMRTLDAGLDAVWLDAPGVTSQGLDPVGEDMAALTLKHPSLSVFGSVAFKYQPHESNPPLAAKIALANRMLPTTSGAGTGKAPSIEKIAEMSAAVNGMLAIASGMTCENISRFAPYLSHILVATGVSKDENHFDPVQLRAFVSLVRELEVVGYAA